MPKPLLKLLPLKSAVMTLPLSKLLLKPLRTPKAVLEAAEGAARQNAQDAMHKAVKHIDARNAMAARVKPFIGAVPTAAMDSAETVAAYACKKFGVKHGKGQAIRCYHRLPARSANQRLQKPWRKIKRSVSTHKPKVGVFGWEK